MLAARIRQSTLKRIFAVFLVAMAGFILVRQAPRVLASADADAADLAPPAVLHLEPIGAVATLN
ncbi:MAG: hypothetical protein SFY69_04430 [Planctomycetota bacterium]|nr:hypothetical protein [Planctomycetota bacterium]